MSVQALKVEASEMNMEIGLSEQHKSELVQHLSVSLADTFMLMLKTQGVHWNVAGPIFYSVHQLTEEHYEDMFEAIDDLAERIRALGGHAPATYKQYGELSSLEETDEPATAEDQIRWLVEDHEHVARKLRPLVGKAEELNDWKTHDLLTERLGKHEQAVWMLRAIIS